MNDCIAQMFMSILKKKIRFLSHFVSIEGKILIEFVHLKICGRVSCFDWRWCMDIGYIECTHKRIHTHNRSCVVRLACMCGGQTMCVMRCCCCCCCTRDVPHIRADTLIQAAAAHHPTPPSLDWAFERNDRMEMKEWQPACERLARSEFSTQHIMVASVSAVHTLRAFSNRKPKFFLFRCVCVRNKRIRFDLSGQLRVVFELFSSFRLFF